MSATSQNDESARRDALSVVKVRWLERIERELARIRMALEVIAANMRPQKGPRRRKP